MVAFTPPEKMFGSVAVSYICTTLLCAKSFGHQYGRAFIHTSSHPHHLHMITWCKHYYIESLSLQGIWLDAYSKLL